TADHRTGRESELRPCSACIVSLAVVTFGPTRAILAPGKHRAGNRPRLPVSRKTGALAAAWADPPHVSFGLTSSKAAASAKQPLGRQGSYVKQAVVGTDVGS